MDLKLFKLDIDELINEFTQVILHKYCSSSPIVCF